MNIIARTDVWRHDIDQVSKRPDPSTVRDKDALQCRYIHGLVHFYDAHRTQNAYITHMRVRAQARQFGVQLLSNSSHLFTPPPVANKRTDAHATATAKGLPIKVGPCINTPHGLSACAVATSLVVILA